jgi:5-carboxymethyl-2-hydroxymuconate isomerase
MPHITVEYTQALDGTFDRRGFARALHPLTAKIIDTRVEACKTRFWRIAEEDVYVGDGEPGHPFIHIELAVLSGRTSEVKAELSEAVLALARNHTADVSGLTVHISVDVTDLDREWYRSEAR